jgi:hypothetical protein
MAYDKHEYEIHLINDFDTKDCEQVYQYRDTVTSFLEKLQIKNKAGRIWWNHKKMTFFIEFEHCNMQIKVLKENYGKNKILFSIKEIFFYDESRRCVNGLTYILL